MYGQLPALTEPIIHRDIKSQNIKITLNGQAIPVDFGILNAQKNRFIVKQPGARKVEEGSVQNWLNRLQVEP